MEFEREEELSSEESQITEEQAPSIIWEHFIKQGIVCAILLITVLWLNREGKDGLIGHTMDRYKLALRTDANSSFGFIRRQPLIDQMITWSKDLWNEMEEEPVVTEEMSLIPPVPGRIRKKFGWTLETSGKEPIFHSGIDIDSLEGSPVRAGGRGTVQEIRQESDGLWRVTLRHADNYRSIYANCDQVIVRIGENIEVGQEIGTVGSGGSEGQVVHWEVWKGIQPIDPQSIIRMR